MSSPIFFFLGLGVMLCLIGLIWTLPYRAYKRWGVRVPETGRGAAGAKVSGPIFIGVGMLSLVTGLVFVVIKLV